MGNAPGGFRDNRMSQTKTYGTETAQTVNYGYNPTSMLTGESGALGGTSTPAFSFSYRFDSMGNRTQMTSSAAKTRTESTHNGLNQFTGNASSNTAWHTGNIIYTL